LNMNNTIPALHRKYILNELRHEIDPILSAQLEKVTVPFQAVDMDVDDLLAATVGALPEASGSAADVSGSDHPDERKSGPRAVRRHVRTTESCQVIMTRRRKGEKCGGRGNPCPNHRKTKQKVVPSPVQLVPVDRSTEENEDDDPDVWSDRSHEEDEDDDPDDVEYEDDEPDDINSQSDDDLLTPAEFVGSPAHNDDMDIDDYGDDVVNVDDVDDVDSDPKVAVDSDSDDDDVTVLSVWTRLSNALLSEVEDFELPFGMRLIVNVLSDSE